MPELKILGTIVGTFDAWYDDEPCCIIFDGVKLNDAFKDKIDPGTFQINYDEGLIKYYNDNGDVIKTIKLLEIIKDPQ